MLIVTKKKKLAADVMFKMGIENLKDMGNGQLLVGDL